MSVDIDALADRHLDEPVMASNRCHTKPGTVHSPPLLVDIGTLTNYSQQSSSGLQTIGACRAVPPSPPCGVDAGSLAEQQLDDLLVSSSRRGMSTVSKSLPPFALAAALLLVSSLTAFSWPWGGSLHSTMSLTFAPSLTRSLNDVLRGFPPMLPALECRTLGAHYT